MSKKQLNQPEEPEELTDQDVCADGGVITRFINNNRRGIAFVVGVFTAFITAGLMTRLLQRQDCSSEIIAAVIQKIDQIRGDTAEGVVSAFIEYHVDDNGYKINILIPEESQQPLPPCPVDEEDKQDKVLRI